ncbi:MAG: hypothetical protein RIR26_1984 [Pseudomonadota bacterium]
MKTNIIPIRSKTQWLCAIALAIATSTLIACVDEPVRRPRSGDPGNGDGSVKTKFDPSKGSITASVTTKSVDGIVKGDYPALTLSFSASDSAQVYRCGASYKLVYGNGIQELTKLSKSDPEYPRAAKDAFLRLRTEGSYCELVKSNMEGPTPPTVNDYGAQSGNFYYVINPCVTSSSSLSGSGGCSYDLQITETLNYVNTRTKDEIEILSNMYASEGELYALFKEIQSTTEAANQIRTTCVLDEADRQFAEAHSRGLLNLVMAIAKPVMSALVPGVGTILATAVDGIVKLKQAQSAAISAANAQDKGCPEAAARSQRVAELIGQVDAVSQKVLEKRQKLHEMDQQYANVERDLNALKSGSTK